MNEILQNIWERKFAFFSAFFVVLTFSYMVLVAIDFVPETPVEGGEIENLNDNATTTRKNDSVPKSSEVSDVESEIDSAMVETVYELPLSIKINKFDKTIKVANPTSRAIADLDTALLDGVVRHPDSAALAQTGNVFILGHSSYLPTVFNKNFQAFNGIQDLQWGDIIEVSSADNVYEYRVEKVYRAKAQDVTVPIAGTEKKLTLATCNSFGSTDDRYIVEAEQINVRRI